MANLANNGGCIIAMKGKDCVAIVTDRRFTPDGKNAETDSQKVFEINTHVMVGLVGLAADTLIVRDQIIFHKDLYEARTNREMEPARVSSMASKMLYEGHVAPFRVHSIVAGVHPETSQPFISGLDLMGYPNSSNNFAAVGACKEQLYTACQNRWRPDLDPNELCNVIVDTLFSAFDDRGDGYGAVVYILEKDKMTVRKLIPEEA